MRAARSILRRIGPRHLAPTVLLAVAIAGFGLACVDDEPRSALGGADASTSDGPTADVSSPDGSAAVDGSADSGSDGKAPLDPRSIPGLVLWLDPSAGVTETGGKVSAWKDTSASGITVTQPTPANQPTKGSVGGKPVIVGGPTTWLEAAGPDVGTKLDFGTSDVFAGFVVSIEPSAAGLGGVFYKAVEDAPPYAGLQMYGNVSLDGKPGIGLDGDTLLAKSPTGNMGDGKLHLVTYWRLGDDVFLNVDGVGAFGNNVGPKKVVDNASPLRVGGRPSGVHSIAHRLGDVLVYKGTLTFDQVAAVQVFLKAKNGI